MDDDLSFWLRNHARELAEAGRARELRALLLDLDYLRRKLFDLGPAALDEDLALLDGDPAVDAARRALRAAAGRLQPLRPANALKVTLLSVLPAPVRSAVLNGLTPRLDPIDERSLTPTIPGERTPTALIGFPDGRWLLRVDERGLAEVFGVALGELVTTLRPASEPVTDAAVDADGRRVVVAGARGRLGLWTVDEESGLPLPSAEAVIRPAAARCAFLPGRCVVIASVHGEPMILDGALKAATTLERLPPAPDRDDLGPLHVGPAGDWLAAQGLGRAGFGAYVWDLRSGRLVRQRPDIGILGPHRDGGLIVAHRDDVVVWDPLAGAITGLIGRGWLAHGLADRLAARLRGGASTWTSHTAADPGGNWLARVDQTERIRDEVVDQEATVRLRDRTDRRLRLAGEVGAVVTEPAGAWLAIGTDAGYAEGEVHLWRPGSEPRHLGRHDGPIVVGAAGGRGSWLATGDRHGTVRLWPTGDPGGARSADLTQAMTVCATRADWFVAVDTDRTAYLVATADGALRHRLVSRERVTFVGGYVFTCAPSRDGSWLATADDDGTVYYWNPADGRRIRTMTGHREQVVAADAADRLVTVDGAGVVIVGSPAGRDQRFQIDLAGVGRPLCRIDPAGRWVAVAAGADLHLLGQRRIRFPARLTALAASPEGLLAGDESGAVHLVGAAVSVVHRASAPVERLLVGRGWTACVLPSRMEIRSAGTVQTIDRNVEPVSGAAVSPDGLLLATVSGERTLRIWDPLAGRPVTGLRAAAGLRDVCWPTGDSVCVAGEAGVTRYRLVR